MASETEGTMPDKPQETTDPDVVLARRLEYHLLSSFGKISMNAEIIAGVRALAAIVEKIAREREQNYKRGFIAGVQQLKAERDAAILARQEAEKRIADANEALGNAVSLEEAVRQTLREIDRLEDEVERQV